MKRTSLSILINLFIFISCGKELGLVQSAPKTQQQAGIIASCTSVAKAQELSESQSIQYRIISKKHKIIEFFKIKKSKLKSLLPQAKLKSNIVYSSSLIESNESFGAKSYGNTAFYGSHTPQYSDKSTSRYFPHLKQIDAEQDLSKGEGVVIAIVDTGVDYNHPHLSPNILNNNSDKHGDYADFKDNDNNGFKDDQVGYDFYNGDSYPNDDNGHGTHVAGLAASTYMGIAPKAKILPVKVLSSHGGGDLATIAAGVLYALDREADIINLSLGGAHSGPVSKELKELINSVKMAKNNNALIIAAAGNGGYDGMGDCNDEVPQYPANINENNVISVASVDAYNDLTRYSNFGGKSVHVAAPGGDQITGELLSVGITNCHGACSEDEIPYVRSMGTSMATPIVSGLAAVIKSKKASLKPYQIRKIIMDTVTKNEGLRGVIKSSGIVNITRALESL